MIPQTIGLALALAITARSGAQEERPQFIQTYSLRNVAGTVPRLGAVPLLTFLRRHAAYESRLIAQPEERPLEPDSLVELVGEIHADDIDSDALELESSDSTAYLRGDGKAVRDAVATLRRLDAKLSRAVEVEAKLFRWSGPRPDRSTVSAAELEKLTRNLDVLWSGRTRTRSNRPASLGRQSWSRYVRTAEIEVAHGDALAEPVLARLFEGIQLVVEPHLLVGSDDLAVFCQVAVACRRGPDGEHHFGLAKLPVLDIPSLDVDAGGFSARIRNGDSMLFLTESPASHGSSVLVAVTVRSPRPDLPNPDGIRVLPVSALSTYALSSCVGGFEEEATGVEQPDRALPPGVSDEVAAVIEQDRLEELIRETIVPDAWDDVASLRFLGGYLIVRGPAGILDATEARVLELQTRLLRTAHVEVSTSVGDDSGETLYAVTFPALHGRHHAALHGVETTSVYRLEAQVAQEISQHGPQVADVFSGVFAWLQPRLEPTGSAATSEIRLIAASQTDKRLFGVNGGRIGLGRTEVARFEHDGSLPGDGSLEFGDGPLVELGGRRVTTRQRLRVTTR